MLDFSLELLVIVLYRPRHDGEFYCPEYTLLLCHNVTVLEDYDFSPDPKMSEIMIMGSYFSSDPKFAFHPTPLKKYCSPDPSNISNLYCDPNIKNNPSKILGPILCMVTNLFRLKKVSISTGFRDQNLVKGRLNSTFSEGSDEVQFGVGRKV